MYIHLFIYQFKDVHLGCVHSCCNQHGSERLGDDKNLKQGRDVQPCGEGEWPPDLQAWVTLVDFGLPFGYPAAPGK